VESYASARKHAAVAELARRRPAPGAGVDAATGVPESFADHAAADTSSKPTSP
jgi:hypothetical protein